MKTHLLPHIAEPGVGLDRFKLRELESEAPYVAILDFYGHFTPSVGTPLEPYMFRVVFGQVAIAHAVSGLSFHARPLLEPLRLHLGLLTVTESVKK